MKNIIINLGLLFALLALIYLIMFFTVRSKLEDAKVEFMWLENNGDMRKGMIVPLKNQNAYGWIAAIRASSPPRWEEDLTIPKAPSTWENKYLVRVSDDRRTAHCEDSFFPPSEYFLDESESFIDRICFIHTYAANHTWTVAAGDPEGQYNLVLTINGKSFRKTFEMQLPEGASKPAKPQLAK